jgi:dUTP pyrophosphatase
MADLVEGGCGPTSGGASRRDRWGVASVSLAIAVKRLAHARGLPLPRHETAGAAGLDLIAANDEAQPITLEANGRALVPTGLVLQIPDGYEGQVRPRSGLALKHGVTVLNAPGTIDADYRGEVQVLLVNCGRDPFVITRGMRIAQLVIAPVTTAILVEQDVLEETARAEAGFGSTGISELREGRS